MQLILTSVFSRIHESSLAEWKTQAVQHEILSIHLAGTSGTTREADNLRNTQCCTFQLSAANLDLA
jgi:hypothetical protein